MQAFARQLAAIPLARSNATMTTAAPSLVLKVGDTLRERRHFTDGEVEAYARVSGDRNPVHLDDIFARQVGGFDRGCVVHAWSRVCEAVAQVCGTSVRRRRGSCAGTGAAHQGLHHKTHCQIRNQVLHE